MKSSKGVEQTVNVNAFTANEPEVIGRSVSQDCDDDLQNIVRRLWRYVVEDHGEALTNMRYSKRRQLKVET